MVKGGQELNGFSAADGQLGLRSCLLLSVDIGCLLRAEVGEGSSFYPSALLPSVDNGSKSQNEFRQQTSFV